MSVATMPETSGQAPDLTRDEIEDFLYYEAELLDNWQLDEWLALFEETATYEVPTAGAADDVDSSNSLFYIADDYQRLCYRINRLKSKAAHSEWPRADLVRLISNIRIGEPVANGRAVTCKFACFRSKNHNTDTFVGHIRYVVTRTADGLKIQSKRVMLDLNSLRPQGRISILL